MLGNFVKTIVVAEVVAVGTAYYNFHQLNTSVEYRAWVGQHAPFVLDQFCNAVTTLGFTLPLDVADRHKRDEK
jgi:hypothetical protein